MKIRVFLFYSAILFFNSHKVIAAGSYGPNSVGTGADDATVGTVAWSGPGNITSSDNILSSATTGGSAITHYLKGTNCSFSVPATSFISGVVVEIERHLQGAGATTDSSIKLVKNGTIQGNDKSAGAGWPGTDAYASFGSSSDTWGLSLTPADVNASDFGAVVSASINGLAQFAIVDHMRITVYADAGYEEIREFTH